MTSARRLTATATATATVTAAVTKAALFALAAGLMASCAVGPDYRKPSFATTPAYKESANWKPTEPSDAL